MAHFAKLDENNVVLEVVVVNNDVITIDGEESEQAGIDFLTELFGHSHWRQTSYNGNFRKNYAGKGFIFDLEFDAFREVQPFPSWKLNYETFKWEAPVPMPEDGVDYFWKWSEINKEWIKVEIPTE